MTTTKHPFTLLEPDPSRVPSPAVPPTAYEVRVRWSISDTLVLIGHDRKGEPMLELRLHSRHMDPAAVAWIEEWSRSHDDPVDVGLTPD